MLSRLALRLAAIQALAPYNRLVTAAMPTIAGTQVYDSRLDPIDGTDNIEAAPIISVFTEGLEAKPYGSGTSRPDELEVDLVVELMILVKGTITLQRADGSTMTEGGLDTPVTDRQHEMMLDVLESQVVRRLEGRSDFDADTELFRKVAKSIRHIHSVPQRDSTRTVRLAARTLTFKVSIAKEKWPDQTLTRATLSGFAILPEPLSTVANALPAGSSGALACQDAAQMLANPAALTKLSLIDVKEAVGRTPTATDFDVETQISF